MKELSERLSNSLLMFSNLMSICCNFGFILQEDYALEMNSLFTIHMLPIKTYF